MLKKGFHMKKVFFVAMVLSSFLYSSIYEDAEDGSISRWVLPTGATVSSGWLQ